jgi:hypothetical protein
MVIIPYVISFIIILFSGLLSSVLSLVFISPISKRFITNRTISLKTIFFIQGFAEGIILISIIIFVFRIFKAKVILLSFGILAIPYVLEQITRFKLNSFAPDRDIPYAKGKIVGVIIAVIYSIL